MKNFLIILGILAVTYLAYIDTKERFKELENIAATTPAQVEMKSPIQKTKGEGVKNKRIDKLDEGINQPDKQILKEMDGIKPQIPENSPKPQIPKMTSP